MNFKKIIQKMEITLSGASDLVAKRIEVRNARLNVEIKEDAVQAEDHRTHAKRPNYEKMRQVSNAALQDASRRDAEMLRLFIAGPYINTTELANHSDNSSSIAKKLRFALWQKFDSVGSTVYLGEDVELRLIGEKNYGEHNNAVIFERHYIKYHLDGVVLLPSSPGSFCETGDWISDEDICKNLLIIIDEVHSGNNDYVNGEVVKFAKQNGASVKYLPYTEHETIANECRVFVDKISSKIRIDKLYGRRA